MDRQPFEEILLLMTSAALAVALLQRVRLPPSLGYLLVGAVIGPHALGVITDVFTIQALAEFGIVFLLFATGLNFSLPRIYALRHLVLGLGTAQVLLTTALVGLAAWMAGLPGPTAFVIGAVFAQSSTTIISKQLSEQSEVDSRHGRLAIAMSVFQDVTTVPFVVVIPLLGGVTTMSLAAPLMWMVLKSVAAIGLVFFAGRWLLRPLFRIVAAHRLAELFTLTVLLISLASAWITQRLGLSMALGAFLAGMTLGETEFRYHIEATIRPFRDMLLGLFFITIGMLLDLTILWTIWPWAVLGMLGLLAIKAPLTAGILHLARIDTVTAWRSGIVLAVGGEFGFALLALALEAGAIPLDIAQIALAALLLSMVTGLLLIRSNEYIATKLLRRRTSGHARPIATPRTEPQRLTDHVIICGYGRIGQSVGQLLEAEHVSYLALDLNPVLVRDVHAAGQPAYYGDATERDSLETVGIADARLLLVSFDNVEATLKLLHHVRSLRPDLPVMVRTRDESHVDKLLAAGATEVVPETREAAMMIAAHVLMLAEVPLSHIARRIRDLRSIRYRLLREFFYSEDQVEVASTNAHADVIVIGEHAIPSGQTLADLDLAQNQVLVTAVIRQGGQRLVPLPQVRLEPDDVLMLYGAPEDLWRVRARLSEHTENHTVNPELEEQHDPKHSACN